MYEELPIMEYERLDVPDVRVLAWAHYLAKLDGAQSSGAGWRFLRPVIQDKYIRYGRAIVLQLREPSRTVF